MERERDVGKELTVLRINVGTGKVADNTAVATIPLREAPVRKQNVRGMREKTGNICYGSMLCQPSLSLRQPLSL